LVERFFAGLLVDFLVGFFLACFIALTMIALLAK